MYKDPKRWAYLFQNYVLLTMLEAHNTPQTRPIQDRPRQSQRQQQTGCHPQHQREQPPQPQPPLRPRNRLREEAVG